jgi:methyl-accepting chemotaxis protein
MNLQITELIIVAAVALTMLLQVIMLVALFVVLRKTIRTMHEELDENRRSLKNLVEKIEPIVERAGEFLSSSAPKVEATLTDIAAVAQKLRAQTEDVQVAAGEVIERVRRQGSRMDSMLTKTLDSVDRAATFMTDAVGKPMRQLSAVLASAKAVVETLRTPTNSGIPADDHDRYQ